MGRKGLSCATGNAAGAETAACWPLIKNFGLWRFDFGLIPLFSGLILKHGIVCRGLGKFARRYLTREEKGWLSAAVKPNGPRQTAKCILAKKEFENWLKMYLLNTKNTTETYQPALLYIKHQTLMIKKKRVAMRHSKNLRVDNRDLLVVGDSFIRLYRNGEYPPLRGTFMELDEKNWFLYTRGSVDFYTAYPGMYVPKSLEITPVEIDESPRKLAEEILALTKMNWNNTQFDNALPITIKAARQVGAILKHAIDLQNVEASYSYYM